MTNRVIDTEMLPERAETPVTYECCIYRVPSPIRRLKEDAYTPNVVSIGPFHHNSHPGLHNMERHKLSYFEAFLERTKTTYDTWICYIKKEVEPHFHHFYSDTLQSISKEKLINIIIVDSGFIFELFCRNYSNIWSKDTAGLSNPLNESFVRFDLVLLENQLPFSLLQSLFDKFFTDRSNHSIPPFIDLTFYYFESFNSFEFSSDNIVKIEHFTDLIRTFHLQYPPEERPYRMSASVIPHLPSATELSNVGVKFKVNTRSEYLLNLEFSRGVLRIPSLIVKACTEILFRNMVAWEQCHFPDECYILDYVIAMDFLINTSRDVDILVQEGVLMNCLGETDSVANIFNSLCKNVTQTSVGWPYLLLGQELNGFYNSLWNKLKSSLKRDYCNTPWKTAATIAGIFLLFLSLVQTFCSILQVIHQ